ncbi:MAG: hypothetical protein JSR37_00090 [Verrucomicrobia bacterium]|nr:hypothetical protein [Verrucomicrobiota bacterium]MBS0637175.1 hypothetical protein [Verrucomicrobiota bacterium]
MNSIQPVLHYGSTLLHAAGTGISALSERVYNAALWTFQHIDRLYNSAVANLKSALSAFTARIVLYSLNELSGNEHLHSADSELLALTAQGSAANHVRFITNDGTSLSTVELLHPEHRESVVYLPTSYEIWQWPATLNFLKELHTAAKVNVYALNYRKTGSSAGFPENEHQLFNDSLQYVQSLIAKGANITVFGSDIGAALAIKVAAAQNLNVIALRPYSSLTEVIQQVFPLAPDFAAQFAKAMDWSLDTSEALPQLQKKMICMYSEQDSFVPTAARLKTALAAHLASLQIIKMDEEAFTQEFPQLAQDPDCKPHIRPLASTERAELFAAIKHLGTH